MALPARVEDPRGRLILAGMYLPLFVVIVNSFSTSTSTSLSCTLQRFAFSGHEAVSLLIVVPIALPGIITGIALNSFFRTGVSLEEASSDLGAGIWTTFRLVTFPQLRSALLAGGPLAFALRFDEIIVTTFTAGSGVTTLPSFILNNMFRPNQAPIVAVIAAVLVAVSVVPIYLAQRLAGSEQAHR